MGNNNNLYGKKNNTKKNKKNSWFSCLGGVCKRRTKKNNKNKHNILSNNILNSSIPKTLTRKNLNTIKRLTPEEYNKKQKNNEKRKQMQAVRNWQLEEIKKAENRNAKKTISARRVLGEFDRMLKTPPILSNQQIQELTQRQINNYNSRFPNKKRGPFKLIPDSNENY
jgi:hypothetical protein